jgi:hypothetical protein
MQILYHTPITILIHIYLNANVIVMLIYHLDVNGVAEVNFNINYLLWTVTTRTTVW